MLKNLKMIVKSRLTSKYSAVARLAYYKKQKLLTLREHLSSAPSLLVGSVLLIFLVFFVLSYYLCLRSEFDVVVFATISAYNDIWFVFSFSYLQEGSCLIQIICVCLRIVVSNTQCYVFCFACLHLVFCVHNATSISGLSILDCPFGIL